jgi:DNA-binding MarR family transcriptional regulator
MNASKPFLDPSQDTAVAWARRKETILVTLKMFRMTLDAVRRHSEWVESRHDISSVDLWALWELAQTPGLRAVDLAKAMAMPRPNTESLLDGLLKRGLLRVESDPQSTTPGIYFVTFDGQRIADASPQFGQGVLKAAMNNLPDEALLNLAQAMSDLVQNLPFLEQSAALQPMAELLRPGGLAQAARPDKESSDGPALTSVI